jgi:hypothetical protein
MARANYIYIVSISSSGVVLSAFTVKHECRSYLASKADDGADLSKWSVLRVRDGARKMSEYPPLVDADVWMSQP